MELSTKNMLYAAKCGEKYVGVFSSPAMAQQWDYDVLEEIAPVWIEGSPDSGQYACMAEGTWTTLMQCDGAFRTEVVTSGPVWGVNLQSALAQLLQPGFRSRGLDITALYLFEIDAPATDRQLENMSRKYRFIISQLSSANRLTNGVISRDFIAEHIQNQQHDAEFAKLYDSKPMEQLMDSIMKANRKTRMARCAFAYARQLKRIRTYLSLLCSMDEVQCLADRCESKATEDVPKDLQERFQRCLQKGGVPVAPFDCTQIP